MAFASARCRLAFLRRRSRVTIGNLPREVGGETVRKRFERSVPNEATPNGLIPVLLASLGNTDTELVARIGLARFRAFLNDQRVTFRVFGFWYRYGTPKQATNGSSEIYSFGHD